MRESIEIFIAFDNEDVAFLKELKNHLKLLETQGLAKVWDASQIVGGADWKQAIDSHLETASIILLLLSANFMASESCYDLAKRAMAKSAPPKIVVIPVLLHEVDWESCGLGRLAPWPANGKPIGNWPDRHAAYAEIARSIRKNITELKNAAGEYPAVTEEPITSYPPGQTSPEISRFSHHQDELFDVFLCHNNKEKAEVKEIAKQLKAQGIRPWLDEWELQPGLPWQRALEQQIGQIKSAAVFVGASGLGPWQNMEVNALLREFVRRGCPIIPVLLKTASEKPVLPLFLAGMTWVNFHQQEPDPIQQLIWGITARKPGKFPV